VCIPAHVWAGNNPAAQQVLDNAASPAGLFRNATAPFELEVEFAAQSQVPTQGRLLLRWKAKDQWWSKVIFGAFQQITIRNGEMESTERNLDFTPMAVKELFNLLQIRQDFSTFIANKQKAHTEQGAALTCIQGQRFESKDSVHDICVEADSHEVRSDEWQFGEEKRKQQFEDYSALRESDFPRNSSFSSMAAAFFPPVSSGSRQPRSTRLCWYLPRTRSSAADARVSRRPYFSASPSFPTTRP
jgi:hypothetical protein